VRPHGQPVHKRLEHERGVGIANGSPLRGWLR
jgi:hypothetical protein